MIVEPILAELKRRQADREPIRVGVIGTGFFGAGAIRQLTRVAGVDPAIVASRTVERAVGALVAAGIDPARISSCDDADAANAALAAGRHVATSQIDLPCRVAAIDVVMEATGDVGAGASVALTAFENRKHLVAANLELQATLGPILRCLADEAGVVYSDVDGDQPGVIMGLFSYCRGLGLEPVVAGNCKGFLNRSATPASQKAFARENGIAPWIACAAADGTKVNLEMAAVANATGMLPARTGMTGVETSLETVVADFERRCLLNRGAIVEYTFGIPSGVFVIARTDDPCLQKEFRYLKLGPGPNFLFHESRVVCHFDAPISVARATLYRSPAITPLGRRFVEVAAYAKRDLVAGQRLDGIGGFDCYGQVMRADESEAAGVLPIGLAGGCVAKRSLAKDEPISWADVEPAAGSLPLSLWRRQQAVAAR